jgi:transposase
MKRGRPLVIEWQESAEELKAAYRHEKDSYRRTRLQALWQLRSGKQLAEVQELVGVGYRTLQRWVQWYRRGGLREVLRRTPGQGAGGGHSPLSAQQQQAVKRQADLGAFRTAQEASRWIEQQWGVQYRYAGIYRLMHRLDLRLKVPRPRSEKASAQAQEAWKKGG